jgi:hypothetical protein
MVVGAMAFAPQAAGIRRGALSLRRDVRLLAFD